MTNLHTVANIYCCDCRLVLGWKYLRAYKSSQKYKGSSFSESPNLLRKIGSHLTRSSFAHSLAHCCFGSVVNALVSVVHST
ncbi:hypothetical protein RDABS01_018965 [Bienertia sinuspersici]